MQTFFKKSQSGSYQKPVQLTQNIPKKLLLKNITIVVLFFYFFFKYHGLFYIFEISEIFILNMFSVVDSFIFYKLYLPTFEYAPDLLNVNIYSTPIGNHRNIILPKFYEYVQNTKISSPNFLLNTIYIFYHDSFTQSHNPFLYFRKLFFFILFIFLFSKIFINFNKFFIFFFINIFFLFFIFSKYSYFNLEMLQYFEFQISESFKNRNLYVDSNYFLSSNSLFGVEKFSDVSSPWLVDYEDMGWGADFDIQNQVEQISERERRYIIEEMNLNFSPHLENMKYDSGSLNVRLLKLRQRLSVYFEVLEKYTDRLFEIKPNFSTERRYPIESNFEESFRLVRNFFRQDDPNIYTSVGTFHNTDPASKLQNLKQNRELVKNQPPRLEISNDFVLSKKNNITNENFKHVGHLSDRKQSVYRKLTDQLPATPNHLKSIRPPDFSKESNYVFERQLQYERSFEFDFKEFLKKKISKRYDFYYFEKNIKELPMVKQVSDNFLERSKPPVDKIKDFYYADRVPKQFKKITPLKNNLSELTLESLLKYWSGRTHYFKHKEPRDVEYVYFKNTDRFVYGYFNKTKPIYDTLHELLVSEKLGIGMFTYQDFDSNVWLSDGGAIQDFAEKLLLERLGSAPLNWWLDKESEDFFLNLKNYVDFYFDGLNFDEKKCIISCLAIFSIDIWFDFDSQGIVPNVNDIFRVALLELLATYPPFSEMVYSKIREVNYYLFSDRRSSKLLGKPERDFRSWKFFESYFSYLKNTALFNKKIKTNISISREVDPGRGLKKPPSGNLFESGYVNYLFFRYNLEKFHKIITKNYFKNRLYSESVLLFTKKKNNFFDNTWCLYSFFNFKIPDMPLPLFQRNGKNSLKYWWLGKNPNSTPKVVTPTTPPPNKQILYVSVSAVSVFKIMGLPDFYENIRIIYGEGIILEGFLRNLRNFILSLIGAVFRFLMNVYPFLDIQFTHLAISRFCIKMFTYLSCIFNNSLVYFFTSFGISTSIYNTDDRAYFETIESIFFNLLFYFDNACILLMVKSTIAYSFLIDNFLIVLPNFFLINFYFASDYCKSIEFVPSGTSNFFKNYPKFWIYFSNFWSYFNLSQLPIKKFFTIISIDYLNKFIEFKRNIIFNYLLFGSVGLDANFGIFVSFIFFKPSSVFLFFRIYTLEFLNNWFSEIIYFRYSDRLVFEYFRIINSYFYFKIFLVISFFENKFFDFFFFNKLFFLIKNLDFLSSLYFDNDIILSLAAVILDAGAYSPNGASMVGSLFFFYVPNVMFRDALMVNVVFSKVKNIVPDIKEVSFNVKGFSQFRNIFYSNKTNFVTNLFFLTKKHSFTNKYMHNCTKTILSHKWFLFNYLEFKKIKEMSSPLQVPQKTYFLVPVWLKKNTVFRFHDFSYNQNLFGNFFKDLSDFDRSLIERGFLFLEGIKVEYLPYLEDDSMFLNIIHKKKLLFKDNKLLGGRGVSFVKKYDNYFKKEWEFLVLLNRAFSKDSLKGVYFNFEDLFVNKNYTFEYLLKFVSKIIFNNFSYKLSMFYENLLNFNYWFFKTKKDDVVFFINFNFVADRFTIRNLKNYGIFKNFGNFNNTDHLNESSLFYFEKKDHLRAILKTDFFSNLNYAWDFNYFLRKAGVKPDGNLNITGNQNQNTNPLVSPNKENFYLYGGLRKKLRKFKKNTPLNFKKNKFLSRKFFFNNHQYFNYLEVDSDRFFFKNLEFYHASYYGRKLFSKNKIYKNFETYSDDSGVLFIDGGGGSWLYEKTQLNFNTNAPIAKALSSFKHNFIFNINQLFVNIWKVNILEIISSLNFSGFIKKIKKFEPTKYERPELPNYGYHSYIFFNKFWREIIYLFIWLKPVMISLSILKYFSEYSDIYNFYLLERQASYGYFHNFFKEWWYFYGDYYIFDLIRLFTTIRNFLDFVIYSFLKFWYMITYAPAFCFYIAEIYYFNILYLWDLKLFLEADYCFVRYFQIRNYLDYAPKDVIFFQNFYNFLTIVPYADYKNTVLGQPIKGVTSIRKSIVLNNAWYYFEFSNYTHRILKSVIDLLNISDSVNSSFYFFFIYANRFFEYEYINTVLFLESYMSEIYSISELGSPLNYYKFVNILEDFEEYAFILLSFNLHNFFEFFGQLFWLDICIFFDFLFERAAEFDTLTDVNPISDSLYSIVEFLLSILSGKELQALPTIFFNTFSISGLYDGDDDNFRSTILNDDDIGDDASHGLSNFDDLDSFEFLGWGSNVSIGTDPGNEFSTINDILDFPAEIDKFLVTDISDFYHNFFGLDSPKIGSIAPSFDITVPVNSLWLVNVLYYNPTFGGMLFIDLDSLFDFIKIIYLDKRIGTFSKLYDAVDMSVFNYKESSVIFFKLKISYFFTDIFQMLDSIYINPFDFVHFLCFYIVYIFSYFGPWVPMFLYIFFIYFSKINRYFEKYGRSFGFNSIFIITTFAQSKIYFIFRYFYFFISNSLLFLKMSAIIVVFLSILYIFTEGLQIFSVLRLFARNQETLIQINGLYFNLERDPFVEKSVPLDEVWDEFKYESTVDDDWSRTHNYKENTETLGGALEESSTIDSIGFSKKHSFLHFLDEQDSEFNSSVSQLTRHIPHQIHNQRISESSFFPKFVKDTILEREFFRESESYGPEIEGSLDWTNRSKNIIDSLEDNWKFNNWFLEDHVVESDHFAKWNWGFSRDNEDYYNDLYDALLLNIADPKWLYNSSGQLYFYDKTPTIFSSNGSQLFNQNVRILDFSKKKELSADSRLTTMFERNVGLTHQSPLLDYFDANPLTDLGIDNYSTFGTSIGTISNSKSVFDDATADIITQYTKHGYSPLTNQPIYFNFIDSSGNQDIDFGNKDSFILENYFDSIYNTKLNKSSHKNYSTITESFYNKFNKKRIPNFGNLDNFHTKMGKNWILENNFKISKFVTDGIPEGYFNPTSYVFKDLSNSSFSNTVLNTQNFSLENTRRRDSKYKKISGNSPSTIFYDSLTSYDIDKLLYYNYDSMFGNFSNYSKYYANNEYMLKFGLGEPNQYWTSRKFPRTRWKWIRKWGYDSPFQEFREAETDYSYDELENYIEDRKLDESVMSDLETTGKFVERSVQKKKLKILKKTHTLLPKTFKEPLFKLGSPRVLIPKTMSRRMSSQSEDFSHFTDNTMSSWIGAGPLKKLKTRGSLDTINTPKFLVKGREFLRHQNTKKLFKELINRNSFLDMEKEGKAYSQSLNTSIVVKDVNHSRVFDKFDHFAKRSLSKTPFTYSLNSRNFYKKFIKNNKNYFFFFKPESKFNNDGGLGIEKPISNFFLKQKEFFVNNKKYTKRPLQKESEYSMSTMGSILGAGIVVNNPYRSKIQEYLISKKDGIVEDSSDRFGSKSYIKDISKQLYLNNQWFVGEKGKPVYNILDVKTQSKVSRLLSSLKNSNTLNNNNRTNVLKSFWKSRKSRRFSDVRGYSANGNHWPLSYRMHGLILPKYSENPIVVNDEEANRDYTELRNPNFARRLNDLEVLGDGFIRELEYFREFNLNPTHMGRVHSDPVWLDSEKVKKERRGTFGIAPFDKDWPENNTASHYGVSQSSMEVRSRIREDGGFQIFKLFGGDQYKDLLSSDLGKKLYDVLDSNYFHSKVDWYSPDIWNRFDKSPWGLDLKTSLSWYGSQPWSIQKNLDSLDNLFSSPNYRVFHKDIPYLDRTKKPFLNIKGRKNLANLFHNGGLGSKNKISGYVDGSADFFKGSNSWSFKNPEKRKKYLERSNVENNRWFYEVAESIGPKFGLDAQTSLKRQAEHQAYDVTVYPTHFMSTVDRNYSSEIKHEWRTKFFQYGKMFRSLEQSSVLQEYYNKFIPLYNRAVTPRQAKDYFWLMYKPYKNNKYSDFFKDYLVSDRGSGVFNKQRQSNWNTTIKNPKGLTSTSLFGEAGSLSGYTQPFPNLGNGWSSHFLRKKMSQSRKNFTLAQFETYDAPELSFENINSSGFKKNNQINFRKQYNSSLAHPQATTDYSFSPESWIKLIKVLERGNFSKHTPEGWWFIKPKSKKMPTALQIRTNYTLDNIFGTLGREGVRKNPLFDENNASHRYEAIENMRRKNVKKSSLDINFNRFSTPFSNSKSTLTAIKNIFEVPTDPKFNKEADRFNILQVGLGDEIFTSQDNLNTVENYEDFVSEFGQTDFATSTKNKLEFSANLAKVQIQNQPLGIQYDDIFDRPPVFLLSDYISNSNNLLDTVADNTSNDFITHEDYDFFFSQEPSQDYDDYEDLENDQAGVLDNAWNYNSWVFQKNDESSDRLQFTNTADVWDSQSIEDLDIDNQALLINRQVNFQNEYGSEPNDDVDYLSINGDDDLLGDEEILKDYFYSKKFNTDRAVGSSENVIKGPDTPEIGGSVILEKVSDYGGNFKFSSFDTNSYDCNFELPENQNAIFNKAIYDKGLPGIFTLKKKYKNIVNFKVKVGRPLFKKIGIDSNIQFLDKNSTIFGNSITQKQRYLGLDLDTNTDSVLGPTFNNFNYKKRTSKNLPTNLVSIKSFPKKSLDFFFLKKSNEAQRSRYKHDRFIDFESNSLSELFRAKSPTNSNTGKFIYTPGSQYGSGLSILNVKKKGVMAGTSPISENMYLDRSSKVWPSLGSGNRFSEVVSSLNPPILKKPKMRETPTTKNKKLRFDFGISKPIFYLGKSSVSKVAVQHFFKYADGAKSVTKPAISFFKNQDTVGNVSSNDYINHVGIGVVKNLADEFKITLPTNPPTLKPATQTAKTGIEESAVSSAFKSAKVSTIPGGGSVIPGAYTLFSSNESIFPSPVIRSLSVDSKLFNKINSLRLHGASKLNDFLYKPKIKHILKNQTNFDNVNSDTIVDPYSPREDTFLYKFEDFDHHYDRFDDSENPIQSSLSIKNRFKNRIRPNMATFNVGDFFKSEIGDADELFSSKSFNFVEPLQKFNKEYDGNFEELEDLDEDFDDLEYSEYETDDDYESEYRSKKTINTFGLQKNLAFGGYADFSNPKNISTSIGMSDYRSDFGNFETLPEIFDSDRLFKPKRVKRLDGRGFVDKFDWLFSMYKKLSAHDSLYGKDLATNVGLEYPFNSFFEEGDRNLEIKKNKNQEDLLSSILMLHGYSKNWEVTNPLTNTNFSTSRDSSIGKHQHDISGFGNSKDHILNKKAERSFDEPFGEFDSNLEDLQYFLDSRFNNLYIPSVPLENSIWADVGGNSLMEKGYDLAGLNYRRTAGDRTSTLYLQHTKPFFKNTIKSTKSPEKKILASSEESERISRANYVSLSDWHAERFPISDLFENINISEFGEHSKSESGYDSSLKKIEKINNLQVELLKQDLAEFFIKSQNTASFNSFMGYYKKKNISNLSNSKGVGIDTHLDTFDKNSAFSPIWNIYNNRVDGLWKNDENVKKVDQLSVFEKSNALGVMSKLFNNYSRYSMSKSSLSLDNFLKKNSINNVSDFLRKTHSKANSQFGRRKYRKLKKKYWHRLDVLERYIWNLTKNNPISVPDVDFRRTKTKPIHSKIATDLTLSGYGSLVPKKQINLSDSGDSYVLPTQTTLNSFGSVDTSTTFNLNRLFQNNGASGTIKNSNVLPKNTSIGFDKFYNFYTDNSNILDFEKIPTSSFLNTDLPIDNANYLKFKLKGLSSENFNILDIKKSFFRLEDSSDFDEEGEDSFTTYSKIRNDMPKLQMGKVANTYLPLPIISTFLSNIPNLSTAAYLEESPKYVNFFKNKKINSLADTNQSTPSIVFSQNDNSFSKINTIHYFKTPSLVDQFSVYHKDPKRPGMELRNNLSKLPIAPFRPFSEFKNIVSRADDYGLGDGIYKNSPVSRRSYDLAIRKFGPDFRTNDVMSGYGQLSDISDFNLNSEEDGGLLGGLGYPILNEQNLYVYDFPKILPKFGGSSIFTEDFLGLVWRRYSRPKWNLIKNKKKHVGPWARKFRPVPYFNYIGASSYTADTDFSKDGSLPYTSTFKYYRAASLLFGKKRKSPYPDFNFEPNFSKYVQVWNSTMPRNYKSRGMGLKGRRPRYYDDPKYNNLFSQNFNKQELRDPVSNSYAHTSNKDYPSDILSSYELSSDKIWDNFSSENISGPFFEKEVTSPISKDLEEKNIGPLGFEEGDSLYDNRVLNRGWFPEKIAFSLGLRSQSKIGSDSSTLELMSDYAHSFAHDYDNFGIAAELEGLKSLDWAGKNNLIFNTIDDIVEGFGIEENIPFKPSRSRELMEWEDYVERPTYEDFDLNNFKFNEDDEEGLYLGWDDPLEYFRFKDDNFTTLPMIGHSAETDSWFDSNYFGNVDSAMIPGISLAAADNNLYDGLVSDFTNFVYEKFPSNPSESETQRSLPLVTNGLYSFQDFFDSEITEFSNYVTTESLIQKHNNSESLENQKRNSEAHFDMLETFKPKDSFSFSPNPNGFLKFDPEWVVNGEGWLGNTGSTVSPVVNMDIPYNYTSPEMLTFTQPKGLHGFAVKDDLDVFGGLDSPYFSLSDYQNNRIIRGRDNDVSNFPINAGWSLSSLLIPNSLNVQWSHRLGSKSFVDFDENNQNHSVNNSNWSTFDEAVSVMSGEGFQFSGNLEDNPDFITFTGESFSQRDLWWRSLSTGASSQSSRIELANSIILDTGDKYRDFLTSFDFKIYGKSWTNTQEVPIPLKSRSFFGDSQINTFLSTSDLQTSGAYSENVQRSQDQDFSYGFFRTSQTNFDLNLNFYGIQLRPLLFKIYNFTIFYLSYGYSSINGKLFMFYYLILSNVEYKLDILLFTLKYFFDKITLNYYFLFYFLKLIIITVKILTSFFNYLLCIPINIQSFLTISESSSGNISFFKSYVYNILLNFWFEFNSFEYLFKISFIFFIFFLLLVISLVFIL